MDDTTNTEITDTTALAIIKSLKKISNDDRPVTEETGKKILALLTEIERAYDADPIANQ